MTASLQEEKATDTMRVVGARTHNLKNIDVEIPRNSFVVITGRSGSGKSSLAIDTIFAEGQRQYIECLSLYARQFFDQSSATEVDYIEGLPPTVCINQNRGAATPRSTVGTLTEVYDYLRLLMAKVGDIRCPECQQPVNPQSLEQICESILGMDENTRAMILSPIVRGRKGRHADAFELIRKERLVRVRVDGDLIDIDNAPELSSSKPHDIDAVTDRIIVREGIDGRLYESVELAARLSDGTVAVSFKVPDQTEWQERLYSTRFSCSKCNASVTQPEPRSFSFNSPYGACVRCSGMGHVESFDIDRVVRDRGRSIDAGAVVVWDCLTSADQKRRQTGLKPIMDRIGLSDSRLLSDLAEDDWHQFVHFSGKATPGLLMVLEKELATCVDEDERARLEQFRGRVICGQCRGTRLNDRANSVFLNDKSISQICELTLDNAADFFRELELPPVQQEIAEPAVEEISHRLKYLQQVGVEYLTLSRTADTLSGGELQRVRLASAIGSGLTGACYVLDEPSVGLHERDTNRLVTAIRNLQKQGNSLVVVEHDESLIRAADYVIDVGPGAGQQGGEIVGKGTCTDLENNESSLTGSYLANRKTIERKDVRPAGDVGCICVRGASGFNLKSVDVDFPLGKLICVSGVSGSGKSTLINRTLVPAIKQGLGLLTENPLVFESINGLEAIEKLVVVDQRPISRTPRGCAATYTGAFDEIRKIFSATKLSKQKGFSASRFSFNSKAGRCPVCEGHGSQKISMKFMADMHLRCEACNGTRFNGATLAVRFREKSIADVLELQVSQAVKEFSAFSILHEKLACLEKVGLGYLRLGQPSTTLSGGEAQRIKLATELAGKSSGTSLYVLDEPTTGLHFYDVQMLLDVLSSLVQKGNTVIVIEHHLDMIRCADWVIDLGPGAGAEGGELVAAGTPERIAGCTDSLTGKALAAVTAK